MKTNTAAQCGVHKPYYNVIVDGIHSHYNNHAIHLINAAVICLVKTCPPKVIG